MSINLHIYPVELPIIHHARILKTTSSLINSGLVDTIHFVGLHNPDVKRVEHLDSHRLVWGFKPKYGWINIPKIRGIIWKLEYHLSIFFTYLKRDVNVIHCNSSEDLPAGVLLKVFKKNVKLIYDCHELETEKRNLKGFNQFLNKLSERFFIQFADHVIVVSDSIKTWYEDHYSGATVSVVRGVPFNDSYLNLRDDHTLFRDKFNIKEGIVYIYQGAFFTGRGIDIILNVFSNPKQKNHVVLMGFGPLQSKIEEAANKYPNIHYQEGVKQNEIAKYTSSADVGICLFENICLSHYYVLPNKFWEYCLSGLAIIASDFPDLTQGINEVENGWNIEVSEQSLETAVNSLSLADIEVKKANAIKNRPNIGWHVEEKKLITIYKDILPAS